MSIIFSKTFHTMLLAQISESGGCASCSCDFCSHKHAWQSVGHYVGLRVGRECIALCTGAETASGGILDPLLLLLSCRYTSGSTGRPKGVLHTTGAACLSAADKSENPGALFRYCRTYFVSLHRRNI